MKSLLCKSIKRALKPTSRILDESKHSYFFGLRGVDLAKKKPMPSFTSKYMYFKYALMGLMLPILAACNLLHSPAPAKSDELTLKHEDCPISVRETTKAFVKGNATPDGVVTAIGCVLTQIDEFKSKARSSTSNDIYSLGEMTSFFGKYFTDVEEFSGPSLKSYFKFKNFGLGGGELKLSKSELTTIENLLKEATPILAEASQYV